jgi:ABC-type transport system involved in cytochrome c biogenesis permease component
MGNTGVSRRLRDLAAGILAVAVLFAVLMLTNERLRLSADRFSGSISDVRSSAPVASLTDAATGVIAVVRDFSVDNTFLFAFLVVAAVLVVLMLRT